MEKPNATCGAINTKASSQSQAPRAHNRTLSLCVEVVLWVRMGKGEGLRGAGVELVDKGASDRKLNAARACDIARIRKCQKH